ncbi:hypothetical protein TNCV_126721 [Trichonephila clavipes]|nr:hypothetical protein TNCV_126721 [Trichonephila clavipes]
MASSNGYTLTESFPKVVRSSRVLLFPMECSHCLGDCLLWCMQGCRTMFVHLRLEGYPKKRMARTATAGSDVVQSGRPMFDDFFQHLWPYIGNNTTNVVFQMVKRLWLIRIDQ